MRSTDGGEILLLRAFAPSRDKKKGWFTRRREGAKGGYADDPAGGFAVIGEGQRFNHFLFSKELFTRHESTAISAIIIPIIIEQFMLTKTNKDLVICAIAISFFPMRPVTSFTTSLSKIAKIRYIVCNVMIEIK